MGLLCDRIGPRRAYTWLLVLGSLPVMGVGLAHDYQTFLLFRLAIGAIGASFVITQYHTSVMFAPNIVGTANAADGGMGKPGRRRHADGHAAAVRGFLSLGAEQVVGLADGDVRTRRRDAAYGIAYYYLTQDTADGDFAALRARGEMTGASAAGGAFAAACRDPRVWALFVIYGGLFRYGADHR